LLALPGRYSLDLLVAWRMARRTSAVQPFFRCSRVPFGLHLVTMSKNYCAFCLEGYTAFFAGIGWLLFALTFSSWARDLSWERQALAAGLILIVCTGIGLSTFEDLGRVLLDQDLSWLGLPSVAVLLENKYGILPNKGQYIVGAGAGLAAGVILLVLAALVALTRRQTKGGKGFAWWAVMITLVAGALLTPTRVLAWLYNVRLRG
jgi:hypothetical protein